MVLFVCTETMLDAMENIWGHKTLGQTLGRLSKYYYNKATVQHDYKTWLIVFFFF